MPACASGRIDEIGFVSITFMSLFLVSQLIVYQLCVSGVVFHAIAAADGGHFENEPEKAYVTDGEIADNGDCWVNESGSLRRLTLSGSSCRFSLKCDDNFETLVISGLTGRLSSKRLTVILFHLSLSLSLSLSLLYVYV